MKVISILLEVLLQLKSLCHCKFHSWRMSFRCWPGWRRGLTQPPAAKQGQVFNLTPWCIRAWWCVTLPIEKFVSIVGENSFSLNADVFCCPFNSNLSFLCRRSMKQQNSFILKESQEIPLNNDLLHRFFISCEWHFF